MNPVRRLQDDGDGLREIARLLARIKLDEATLERDRAEADRLAYQAKRAGASYGAMAAALGITRSGVQGMVRRGKLREDGES
jgi:hypothetical protein